MNPYTDEDVQIGGEAVLEHGLFEPEHAPTGHRCIARDVLNAVAHSIAARAFAAGYARGTAWDGWLPSDGEAMEAALGWLNEDAP